MKLKEYISKLESLVQDNPDAAEFDVVYSGDDEGNYFQEVYYGPSLGNFDCGEYTSDSDEIQEYGMKINAVCIN